MEDRVPERRDSHASSSHEPSFEPTPTRSVDLGKHSVYTHFPKDRNCEICQRTKITGEPPCRRRIGGAVTRAENFGDLTTADHKVLSEGCESRHNHQYAVVVQGLATQWIQSYPCKAKNSQENTKGACKSSWSRIGSQQSFTLTIPWTLAKPVKIFPGIIVRRHHTDRKHMAVRRVKESTSAVLLRSGLDENWCADSMECYTYLRNIQDLLSDGETPRMRDVLGSHLKDRLFHLVYWLSITLSLRTASQESINLERKSYLASSLDTLCTRGEFGRVTYWSQTLRSWDTMDASEIYSKRLNAKEVIFSKEWKIYFSSRRWTNQTSWTPRSHIPSGRGHERARFNLKRPLGGNPRTGFLQVSPTPWLDAGTKETPRVLRSTCTTR